MPASVHSTPTAGMHAVQISYLFSVLTIFVVVVYAVVSRVHLRTRAILYGDPV